jgi:hypothetical protein
MPKTEAQKRAQKKWKQTHREAYNEKQRVFALQYYYNNREDCLAKKKIYYQNKKNEKLDTEPANIIEETQI